MKHKSTVLAGALVIAAGLILVGGLPSRPPGSAAGAATSPVTPAAGNPAVTGAAAQAGRIDFAPEQGDLDLQLRSDQTVSTWVQVVFSKNIAETDSTKDTTVSPPKFYLDMEGGKTFSPCTVNVATLLGDNSWNPKKRSGIPITITNCRPNGGKGTLVITGSTNQKTLQVTLRPRRSCGLTAAMIVSLVGAIAICLICANIVSGQGHKMSDEMGPASWDFSSSWASNITAFGTGFTFLLQLIAFPDKPLFATRVEYMFVAAFATALVAFAPAVHRFISAATLDTSQGAAAAVPEGLVGGFLTASVFTIWGTLFQSVVELLIVFELIRTATVYCPIGSVVGLCVGIGTVALIVYSYNTLLSTIAFTASRTGKISAPQRARFSLDALDRETARKTRVSVL
jgi:hypothetical protein